MRSLARFLPAAAAALLMGPLLTACSGDDKPAADPGHRPTPLSAFDAATVQVQRGEFCDRLSDDVVAASVGEVESTQHYGNGESATLTGTVKDVSHEFNCTFVGADGTVARAWVFVPRVPPARAKALVADARKKRAGCSVTGSGGFGTPSAGNLCRSAESTVATYSGLFVDAWLSCSLSVPDPASPAAEVRKRAGEWCVEAAKAASSPAV
jgi:hypothetical protein